MFISKLVEKLFLKTLREEMKTLGEMARQRNNGWRFGVVLRILYFILYPFFINKKIWLFMDLPDRADDNSYKLFRYVTKQDSDIKCVFVLDKSSKDFEKIQDVGTVIAYNSFGHKLYSLFAQLIIVSHLNNYIIYPFGGNFDYLSGLICSWTVFTQHGVTVHDTSFWLNRFDKNLEMIVFAAKSEADYFLKYNYGYSKDTIKLCGFPRYDYLEKLEDRKEILIMPTWRRKYDALDGDEFVKLDFFKNYNALLNDDELINYLSSRDYKLVFGSHNNLIKFEDLFERHPQVEFSDMSYENLFNHSSLMITDFSSVILDFAYLKKPVIYYHFDSENYHFDL